MSVLLVHKDREYLCQRGEELQTDLGVLTVPDDAASGDTVATHLGEVFQIRYPRIPDLFRHLERTGAPMMPRDIGLLIGQAGIESRDRVLDVGTGTGILAAALGRLGATVVSYERNGAFAEVARENMRAAGVDGRVEIRHADILDEGDAVSGFDVLTLDTADAASIVATAPEFIQPDGVIAAYTPFVEDTREVVLAAEDAGVGVIGSFETLQRRMDFDARGSRPTTAGVGHTGYLTFCRR